MSETTTLRGKHAVVTGAGRGIGAEIARQLAGHGVEVALVARSEPEIEAVAERLRANGHRAVAIPCDVGSEDAVAELRERVSAEFPRVEILVNNAGVAHSAPLARIELADWERLLRVNATGTLLCTRAFVPAMIDGGWGRIVNVASSAGIRGGRYIAAYAASKHAVIGLTRSLALELAEHGVTVNAVCPGYVDTEMTDSTLDNITSRTGLGQEEALGAILSRMPQHRLLQPEEVAHAVLALCAPEAAGINGQAIPIDGGESAG